MADVKWIKIVTDIFDDEKILLIESLPGADSIVVIWFKLLCLAGKNNNSGVFMLNDRIAYTDEMLATIFRREINTVRLALSTFEQFGMIEVINNIITIPNWSKHQSLDQLESKKEYMREYMQGYREKQKQIVDGKTSCKTNSKTNSKAYVSSLDKDIEKEEEKEKDIKDIVEKEPTALPIVKEIVDYLNLKAGTKYKANSDKTRKSIEARMNEGYTVEDFKTVINKKTKEWLKTDMSKYLRPETLFGSKFESYLNQLDAPPQVKPSANKNKFNNFNQRTYDYDSLEAQLLNRNIGG